MAKIKLPKKPHSMVILLIKLRRSYRDLRATCCNGHLYLCKIEKIDFLKICQEEGFY